MLGNASFPSCEMDAIYTQFKRDAEIKVFGTSVGYFKMKRKLKRVSAMLKNAAECVNRRLP